MNRKLISSLTTLMTIALFSNCSYHLAKHNSVELKDKTPDAEIKVMEAGVLQNNKEIEPQEDNTYKLSLGESYLLIQEKEGFRSMTTPLIPSKNNNFFFADLGIGTGTVCAPLFLSYPGITLSSLAFGGYYVYQAWYKGGMHKLHPDYYNVPQLSMYPKRDESERFLYSSGLHISLEPDSIQYVNSDSPLEYADGKFEVNTETEETVNTKSFGSEKFINSMLGEFDYIDSMNLYVFLTNPYRLEAEVTKLMLNDSDNFFSVNLGINWKILNSMNNKEITSFYDTSSSNWTFGILKYASTSKKDIEDAKQELLARHFRDAIEQSLITILNEYDVSAAIDNNIKQLEEELDNLNAFTLNNTRSKETASLATATSATVTIQNGSSHGSGFAVSNDGYILTCYHVTGDTEKDLEVILSNGSRHKCRIIRINPFYDLALLKVDGVDFNPIELSSLDNSNLGKDVFAIGTPQNISLGQTLTRGIISANRSVDGREFIQTDTPINSGNSGGPLTSNSGNLIGIVNAKLVGMDVDGIGFAIPASQIKEALKLDLN